MNEYRRKINSLWLMLTACLWVTHTHAAPLYELKLPPEQVQETVPRAPVESAWSLQKYEEQKKRNAEFEQNNDKIRNLFKRLKQREPKEN